MKTPKMLKTILFLASGVLTTSSFATVYTLNPLPRNYTSSGPFFNIKDISSVECEKTMSGTVRSCSVFISLIGVNLPEHLFAVYDCNTSWQIIYQEPGVVKETVRSYTPIQKVSMGYQLCSGGLDKPGH